jgi:dipeptidyl aminopeptidase/acylaminoacyl peptidase
MVMFAASVTGAGMSDLRTFFAGTEPWMAASVTEYGDPVADRDMLAAISPMTTLDRLVSPVLFVHGDRDTNVPLAQSVQAHQALQALGAPSDLLLLPGEGHTVVGRDSLVELTGRVIAWFDRWL